MSGSIFLDGPDDAPFAARCAGGSLDGTIAFLPWRYPIYKHAIGRDVEWYRLVETVDREPLYLFVRRYPHCDDFRWKRSTLAEKGEECPE